MGLLAIGTLHISHDSARLFYAAASSKRGTTVSSGVATKTLSAEGGGGMWSDEDLDRRSLGASSRSSDRSRLSWTTTERPPSRLDEVSVFPMVET